MPGEGGGDGWSLTRLGKKFGCAQSDVRTNLVAHVRQNATLGGLVKRARVRPSTSCGSWPVSASEKRKLRHHSGAYDWLCKQSHWAVTPHSTAVYTAGREGFEPSSSGLTAQRLAS